LLGNICGLLLDFITSFEFSYFDVLQPAKLTVVSLMTMYRCHALFGNNIYRRNPLICCFIQWN